MSLFETHKSWNKHGGKHTRSPAPGPASSERKRERQRNESHWKKKRGREWQREKVWARRDKKEICSHCADDYRMMKLGQSLFFPPRWLTASCVFGSTQHFADVINRSEQVEVCGGARANVITTINTSNDTNQTYCWHEQRYNRNILSKDITNVLFFHNP